VRALRERVELVRAGIPRNLAVDRAFARVAAQYAVPPEILDALIEGLAWDAADRHYRTLSELVAYATRVSATVSAILAIFMGASAAESLARACDLGVATQLTRIARDVGSDAHAGRLYLPLDWLDEAGVDPVAFLARPEPSLGLRSVVQRLLGYASTLYRRGERGVPLLPCDCRASVRALLLLASHLGTEIARNHYDSISRRARISPYRKLLLLGHALFRRSGERAGWSAGSVPPLLEAQFLVDAASRPSQASKPLLCKAGV
jgi:phytoene synthase